MNKKSETVLKAEQILGYEFKNPGYIEEALRHASYADSRLESNERMEFLGDAILGFVVCEYLYGKYPEMLEGELTKIKSAVVSRRVCAEISQSTDLVSLLSLGKGMIGRPSLPSSVAAAVYESVIAAIYHDGGIDAVKKYIFSHMEDIIEDAEASAHQQNFKSVLQQYAQKHLPMNPNYVLLDEKGPDHSKCFEIAVEIDGRQFSSAWASSKKESEQKAALSALLELGLAECDDKGKVKLLELINGPVACNDAEKANK